MEDVDEPAMAGLLIGSANIPPELEFSDSGLTEYLFVEGMDRSLL
jgi:hypothetical protein